MTLAERQELQKRLALLNQEQQILALKLMAKLSALGISSTYSHFVEGPLVETYYFTLSSSTPLSKIMTKSEDVAYATGRESALILRDGAYIGVQLSSINRKKVDFSASLFQLSQELLGSRLPILLGQTHKGEYVYLDLADEPHALIAGSTGSGKSMFLLSTICTIAVAKRPEEVKLYIVDSKQVDLTICEGLPHVCKIARNALELHDILDELHNEMRRRNALLSGIARNIDEYNQITEKASGTRRGYLPRILLVIDEFADLLEEDYLQAKAKIEPFSSLSRLGERLRYLAQLSRASGIHIIAATQRPSVKITSGDLKVNLPCRISFKLTSIHDSKTVLRESGAEFLLGQGDMLVQSVSRERMFRAHAPYVELDTLGAILSNVEGVRDTLIRVAFAEAKSGKVLSASVLSGDGGE
jgi:S-DNA-T family DNA segregation ATPase FtsK/SpoIIIE